MINLLEQAQAVLDELGGGSVASYAIRYADGFDGMMVLFGMSSLELMVENISLMKKFHLLDDKELQAIYKMQKIYHFMNLISCTVCQCCVAGCHQALVHPQTVGGRGKEI